MPGENQMAGNLDFRLNLLANTSGLEQGMNGAKFAVNALVAAMAAVGVGVSVKGLADAADSYTNLSARINIATKDGGNFTSAMAGVHQVALATNSSLDATAGLFTKVNDVGKQMGLTQEQSLDLVKTINMAIQTGGGSAQASEAAITQFTQALQSGVLRGDEFNSIMEQAPGISKALAQSLGVTTGELRKMAENGELSAEKVIKALQSQSAAIEADYAKFPTTIGNALQRIQTQWQILIGTMDQANGASATVAQWLVTLADNMDIVTVLLDDIGEGFVWVGDQLKKIDTATIEAFKTALESAYDTLKILASSVGAAFEITADVLNTALGAVFDFGSGVDTASDKTNGLTKVLQAINVVIGFAGDGFSAISIGLNLLAGVVYDVAGAFTYWKSKLLFGDAKDQALKEYEELAAKAQEYYTKASNGAMEFKSKGIEAVNDISKTQKEKDAESVASSKAKLESLLADQKTEVDGKKSSEEDKVKAVQDYADEAVKANNGVLDSAVQLDLQSKGYMVTLDSAGKVVVTSMAAAKQATEENAKATELAQEKAKQAETDYQEFIKSSAAERIQLQKQIEQAKVTGDLTALNSAKTSLAAIDTREAELNEIRKQRNAEAVSGAVGVSKAAESAAKGAAEALGINLDVSLNRISKSFKEAGGQVVTLSNDVKGLGVSGKEASNLIYEGWVKWLEKAKSPAEIDMAKAKLQEFEDKGVFSTKQVELGMQAIQRATAKLPDDLDEVGAAFERLGIKTKEQLRLSAQMALADFETVRQSGQATQADLQKAYEKTIQLAYASGDAQSIAAANAKAASLGLSVQVDETGKVAVKSNDDWVESNHRVRDSARGIGDGYRHAGQIAREEAKSSTEAWADAVNKAKGDFNKEMKRQGEALSKGIYDYSSYSKSDVLSELKSKGYDDKDAQKLAGEIWSKAMAADRSAKEQGLGKESSVAMKALINAEFDRAAANGITTQHGTNKINDLLRNINVASTGSYAPSTPSSPSTSNLQGGGKTVNYQIQFDGKTLDFSGTAEQESLMNQLVNQLKVQAKST
ncbi:tape measure protein [Acinetobacter sp. AS5]|uniref:tape measure protein n=1 Tax=Acinetobacter sp. AS5 TaxID=3029187 RepID=UPI003B983B33